MTNQSAAFLARLPAPMRLNAITASAVALLSLAAHGAPRSVRNDMKLPLEHC